MTCRSRPRVADTLRGMPGSTNEQLAVAADWRAEVLDGVLRVVLAIGIVAAALSVTYAIIVEAWSIAIVDTIAIALVAALATTRGLTYTYRAIGFLVLLYALGTFLLFSVGLAAHIYLMGFVVFTAVLIGLRPALVAGAVTIVTLVTIALTAHAGPTVELEGIDTTAARLVVIANFAFVSIILAAACATLLRRVETSLHEQRAARLDAQRLARAVEQTSDVILIADPTGHVQYSNQSHRELVDRLGESARFRHLDQIAPDLEPGTTPTDVARRNGEWRGHLELLHQDDHTTVEFDVYVEAITDDSGDVINLVGSLVDVTADRSYERRLRRAERLEALGTLAAGVAHDFNNILTTILGSAEHFAARTDDERSRVDAATIVAACHRARDVIEQIMVFGDRATVDQVPTRVADAVRETVPLIRAAIGRDIEIVEDLRSDARVLAHPGSLGQVIVNLVSNAADAIGDRQGTITIHVADVTDDGYRTGIDPTLTSVDGYVALSVTDTGTGIDPAHLDQIFDPFFTTKPPGDGSGLGLSSVHAVVTAAGGEVGVYSEPGTGTTIRVLLPVAAAPDRAHASEAHDRAPADSPAAARQLRILLVDDEPTILAIVARGLEEAGHVVHAAENGVVAGELFDADPSGFDLLITDLTMPGMGGRELIRHVRAGRPDLPVILTSGFGHDRADTALASLGLTAFLVKPFSHAELFDAVRRVG